MSPSRRCGTLTPPPGCRPPPSWAGCPALGPRFSAVLSATARFLYPAFLDEASDADLSAALTRFYEAVVDPPLHAGAIQSRIGIVRHGLGCLLRGRDPLPARMGACLAAGGPYHVAGLGPAFWSALFQAARRRGGPAGRPRWSPGCGDSAWPAGDPATGRPPSTPPSSPLTNASGRWRRRRTALHVDHFLTLVASMQGPRPAAPRALLDEADPVADAVRRVRGQAPLRQRLKERGDAIAQARERMEAGTGAERRRANRGRPDRRRTPPAGRASTGGPTRRR